MAHQASRDSDPRLSRGLVTTALTVGGFLLFAWLERKRPLRRAVEPKLRREGRNLAVAGIGAAAIQLAGAPVVQPLTLFVERRRWGLLRQLRLPKWLETAAALLMMDYTFYVWHRLTHKMPLLWRFHLVHHTDLDLDSSTALRFHFGELIAGVPWQAAQIIVIGLTPRLYSMWTTTFLISILFHHSDLELPIEWERRLSWFLVTPRMHGIHHSIVERESNSNLSSGLNIWDRLHGTLRLNVPQEDVVIGVPAYRDPIPLPQIICLPFERLPPAWQLPGGGKPSEHSRIVPEKLQS